MRTINEDEFSDDEEFWLLQQYDWDLLEEEEDPWDDGEEVEDVNPDLYDQYEYMLEHQDDEV